MQEIRSQLTATPKAATPNDYLVTINPALKERF